MSQEPTQVWDPAVLVEELYEQTRAAYLGHDGTAHRWAYPRPVPLVRSDSAAPAMPEVKIAIKIH